MAISAYLAFSNHGERTDRAGKHCQGSFVACPERFFILFFRGHFDTSLAPSASSVRAASRSSQRRTSSRLAPRQHPRCSCRSRSSQFHRNATRAGLCLRRDKIRRAYVACNECQKDLSETTEFIVVTLHAARQTCAVSLASGIPSEWFLWGFALQPCRSSRRLHGP